MSWAKVILNMARSRSKEYLMNRGVPGFLAVVWFVSYPIPSPLCSQRIGAHIYRSTGQRSMFQTSMFCRSTALYINKNWLKNRTKCHLKMLCRSTALYINHCWYKNHFSFILFHRSIIICRLCFKFQKHTTEVSIQDDFFTYFSKNNNHISTFECCLHS